MLDDSDLGFFVNWLAIAIVFLVVGYHVLVAEQ